jgi:hypothetical protein
MNSFTEYYVENRKCPRGQMKLLALVTPATWEAQIKRIAV